MPTSRQPAPLTTGVYRFVEHQNLLTWRAFLDMPVQNSATMHAWIWKSGSATRVPAADVSRVRGVSLNASNTLFGRPSSGARLMVTPEQGVGSWPWFSLGSGFRAERNQPQVLARLTVWRLETGS